MRRLPFALSLSVLATLFAFLGQGCSAQGEGQRCNIGNNNDDCAEGLVCKSSRELGGSADICCPETGTTDAAECIPGGTTGTGGAGTGGAGTGASSAGGAGAGGAGTGAGGTGGSGTGGTNAGGGGATGTGGAGGGGGAGGA